MKLVKATIHGIVISKDGSLLEITTEGKQVSDELALELSGQFGNQIAVSDIPSEAPAPKEEKAPVAEAPKKKTRTNKK